MPISIGIGIVRCLAVRSTPILGCRSRSSLRKLEHCGERSSPRASQRPQRHWPPAGGCWDDQIQRRDIVMKGTIFVLLVTLGGSFAALFDPFIGAVVYIGFALLRPDALWGANVQG